MFAFDFVVNERELDFAIASHQRGALTSMELKYRI